MAPVAMLLIADPKVKAQTFPELGAGKAAAEALTDHLLRFSLAGLTAVAAALGDQQGEVA
jgi:hypothetical protein